MPKAYFEPDNLHALVALFEEAKSALKARMEDTPENRDYVASRILQLASEGMEPGEILERALVLKPINAKMPERPERSQGPP